MSKKNWQQFQNDLTEVTISRNFKEVIRRKLTYEGTLKFEPSMKLWLYLVLQQVLIGAGVMGSLIAGFTLWAPILFITPVLMIFCIAFLYRSYLDLSERGWADAIFAIEHRRMKLQTYEE